MSVMPASTSPAEEQVVLHRKGCVCRRCKMNGNNSGRHAQKIISRADWVRLGKPSTIESYLSAVEREKPPATKEDVVVLHGSNRAAHGGIAPKAKLEVPRAEWERLGRPGTTNSYFAALEREKTGPTIEPDTITIRGSVKHRGGDASKLTKEIPRVEWERLGRPRTIDRYHLALEAEKKAGGANAG